MAYNPVPSHCQAMGLLGSIATQLLLQSFWANEAIFQLMMLAYNLFLMFEIDMVRATEYRERIKTFLLRYIFLAG